MRRFSDAAGRVWDVVAGRESWGAFYAIFVPRTRPGVEEDASGGSPGVLQTPLGAADYGEANEELDRLSDSELRELLERSTPKSTA